MKPGAIDVDTADLQSAAEIPALVTEYNQLGNGYKRPHPLPATFIATLAAIV